MRKASESPFPYSSKMICYIGLDSKGNIFQIPNAKTSIEEAYNKAILKEWNIYAVWPGQYSSDLFFVDDLSKLADAYGISYIDSHVHDVEWKISEFDDGKSLYADVDIIFRCGCKLDFNNIRKIAADLEAQKGFIIRKTGGFGYHYVGDYPEYTIGIKRSTLKKE